MRGRHRVDQAIAGWVPRKEVDVGTAQELGMLRKACPTHPVALCIACRRGYTPGELAWSAGGTCACPRCTADITDSVQAHMRLCPQLSAGAPTSRSRLEQAGAPRLTAAPLHVVHRVESRLVASRVSTGLPRLDAMLGGGLLPGTLTVVYGATGIGKTHLGLTFANHGLVADGARGVVLDLNGRGDSQQHDEYAGRLFGWGLTPWTHTVTPMADPYPSTAQMDAYYSNALPWVGRVRDFQVPTADGGWEFDWNWKAAYNHALYTVRPFLYFHFAAGTRRIVVDGVEPMDAPADSIQFLVFHDLYRKTIHRDAETLGMEICLPVWQHRSFIDAHRYDHGHLTTLLLVTTEETRLEDLLARKVAVGDIGATANTIVVMGSERVGLRLARMLCVVKHRGSAMSDEIVEYRVGERGLEM
jgi:RecA/RadA recombinase